MRSKEDALDYRYFPEPDLPPLEMNDKRIKRLKTQIVKVPYDTIKIMKEKY
jgi:aspartyl-tRNA(Asn)/glutamyl-tRNA(Gln) amidotransferase subunit B